MIEDVIKKYTQRLERKKILIAEYVEEKNSIDGFISSKREIEYHVLYSEINMIENLLNNLRSVEI